TIDRETPVKNLQKVTKEGVEVIAAYARIQGFEVSVSA
ncbi:MAG: radical SAM protein, partial [Bacteroidia bacterium]